MDNIQYIERFYADIFDEERHTSVTYLQIRGNSYEYLYRPTRRAAAIIADRMKSGHTARDVVIDWIKYTPRFRGLVGAVPRLAVRQLELPPTGVFDCAIIGTRAKTIHLNDEKLYTIPNREGDSFEEVEIRRTLPSSITVPEIIEADLDYPYFVEEYVDGRLVDTTLEGVDHLFAGLEQLEVLYGSGTTEPVTTEAFLEQHRRTTDDPLVRTALDVAETLSTPDKLTRGQIHGDLHRENFLVTKTETYLLDWEQSETNLVIVDFFKYFEIDYDVRNDVALFGEMVTGEGRGGTIAERYASEHGRTAFGDTEFPRGLPLLYLVHRVNAPGASSGRRELLRDLLDFIGHI